MRLRSRAVPERPRRETPGWLVHASGRCVDWKPSSRRARLSSATHSLPRLPESRAPLDAWDNG
eukprot:8036891-Pyramimonas_sp.AAC.1